MSEQPLLQVLAGTLLLLAIAAIFYALFVLAAFRAQSPASAPSGADDEGDEMSVDTPRNWGGDAQRGDGNGGVYDVCEDH